MSMFPAKIPSCRAKHVVQYYLRFCRGKTRINSTTADNLQLRQICFSSCVLPPREMQVVFHTIGLHTIPSPNKNDPSYNG